VLFRLLTNGQFDSSFGQHGVAIAALLESVAEAYAVVLQEQNLVITGDGSDTSTGTVDIISARFLPDGTWDKTYGNNRMIMIDVADRTIEAERSQSWHNRHLRFYLFSQVILKPHLLDRFQLHFDPIDMLIHVFGHILKHVTRGEVGHLRTMHHALV
jgi:hypothetical protein